MCEKEKSDYSLQSESTSETYAEKVIKFLRASVENPGGWVWEESLAKSEAFNFPTEVRKDPVVENFLQRHWDIWMKILIAVAALRSLAGSLFPQPVRRLGSELLNVPGRQENPFFGFNSAGIDEVVVKIIAHVSEKDSFFAFTDVQYKRLLTNLVIDLMAAYIELTPALILSRIPPQADITTAVGAYYNNCLEGEEIARKILRIQALSITDLDKTFAELKTEINKGKTLLEILSKD